MNALSAEELMAWVARTSGEWRQLLTEHPAILDIACDIRETTSVRGLIQHIVAVELRYVERLHDLPQTPYEQVPMGSVEELFATHERAFRLWEELLSRRDFDWEEPVDFVTRSAGTMRASRRTLLVHALMHSIRHFAQLATQVRHHGFPAVATADYLSMGVLPGTRGS